MRSNVSVSFAEGILAPLSEGYWVKASNVPHHEEHRVLHGPVAILRKHQMRHASRISMYRATRLFLP